MAKNIAWDYLKYYSANIPGIKPNESELKVDYSNGGRFQLFGADNPDSLRGMYFDFVIFDEYSFQPPNIFTEIIRPCLADREGGAMWIGTYKSKRDSLYKLFHESQGDNWYKEIFPVSVTKALSESELLDMRNHMSEEEYLQELECIPMDFVKGSYYGEFLRKSKEKGLIGIVPYDKSMPVHTVWDLGISDDMAIGFFQIASREPRWIDYYHNSGYGLDHYIKVLKDKEYVYGKHIAPHDINVRELSSGKSRKEIAKSFGIDFETAPQVSVKDGIDAARIMLSRLWIDEKCCTDAVDAIMQYRKEWDDSKGCFKDNPLHDWTSHAADVLRYFAVSENILKQEISAAKVWKPKTAYY